MDTIKYIQQKTATFLIHRLMAALLIFISSGLMAQNAFTVAGGDASGNGGTVSYSFGQVFYQSQAGSSGTVIQGVQQPYEISVIVSVSVAAGITLNVVAYPNPVTDFLRLRVDSSVPMDPSSLSYLMYDSSGRLLERSLLEGQETLIPMSDRFSGVYIVKVIRSEMEVKTFKIIKN
jgi:hypothetical protein